MCGIIGAIGILPEETSARLESARDLMRHRGPDAAGSFRAERVYLGFRRLSILDLSPAAHQPMASPDGHRLLLFNGEIYNYPELRRTLEPRHQFRSRTDSEVLLHGFAEWGWDELLRRIDGMFAFSIWDATTRTLYAARDRVGKKPFYYAQLSEGLVFASTLNALLAVLPATPDIDSRALDAYLTYQAVPAPMTMYAGITQLPPAHSLIYCEPTHSLRISRYWELRYSPKSSRSEAEVLEDLEVLLRLAVRKRLASDVPLGAFLSGGVDSSLVVSLMAQEREQVPEAVVIGFEEAAFDERPHARAVAQRWGVRLHEVILGVDALSELPHIVWHYGQPVADVSIVPTFAVARAAKQAVTVVLNGDGGDEAFGGYARPVVQRMARPFRRLLPAPVRAKLAHALRGKEHGMLRRASMLAEAAQTPAVRGFTYQRGFRNLRTLAYTESLHHAVGGWSPDELYAAAWLRADAVEDVDRALYGDFATYLPDQLLVKMDVSTMAHGVEARSPLLDVALLEYAATIPTRLRLKGYQTKYLLKRLAERYVPPEVVHRRKRGFVMPAAPWLRKLDPVMRSVLTAKPFRDRGWIRPEFLEGMLLEHGSGHRDWSQQLWTLLTLEIWARLVIDRTLTRDEPLEALL